MHCNACDLAGADQSTGLAVFNVLSNLAYLAPGIFAFYRNLPVLGALTTTVVFTSSFYHMCLAEWVCVGGASCTAWRITDHLIANAAVLAALFFFIGIEGGGLDSACPPQCVPPRDRRLRRAKDILRRLRVFLFIAVFAPVAVAVIDNPSNSSAHYFLGGGVIAVALGKVLLLHGPEIARSARFTVATVLSTLLITSGAVILAVAGGDSGSWGRITGLGLVTGGSLGILYVLFKYNRSRYKKWGVLLAILTFGAGLILFTFDSLGGDSWGHPVWHLLTALGTLFLIYAVKNTDNMMCPMHKLPEEKQPMRKKRKPAVERRSSVRGRVLATAVLKE